MDPLNSPDVPGSSGSPGGPSADPYPVSPGRSAPLGVTVDGDGVNVAVWAPEATTVEFCLFTRDAGADRAADADGAGGDVGDPARADTEIRVPLPWRDGGIRYAHVPGPRPGDRYGLRVDGVWDPSTGRYANHAKLLIDPYAQIIESPVTWHPLMSGFTGDGDADPRDSAPVVPKCVIAEPDVSAPGHPGGPGLPDLSGRPARPRHDAADLVIYEAHLKGLSAAHPGVPEDLRGTYAGMAHPAVLGHLTDLGVTAVELLPLQTFIDDRFLVNRGLTNYWGYQPVNWFAPEPRYATDRTGVTADRELRALVDALHTAGIEVIVDVVYNHSGEGDELGPTLSLRGLDNNGHYLMDGPEFVNDTGTGNTLAVDHLPVLRLVTDSLRHWVTHVGVDGFRFDLGATLGRTGSGAFAGFDPDAPFFRVLAQDPVLSQVRLIAEPWDIGPDGYRLGQFPWPWAEWNDRFRDGVRRLWRGETPGASDLGSLFLGSACLFGPETTGTPGQPDGDGSAGSSGSSGDTGDPGRTASPVRPPRAATTSVNFLSAHDGFTLTDVVSYNDRHNGANGENGQDGHGENFSDNLGVEGPTDDPAVTGARSRRVRGMLATLLLAQGTPMLLAGDELGNSQGGNNNAYVQDNPTGWVDWGHADPELTACVRELVALRLRLPVLRQVSFRHGGIRADGRPDVEWFGPSGAPMDHDDWHSPDRRRVGVVLRGTAGCPVGEATSGAVAVVVNPGGDVDVTLPDPVAGAVRDPGETDGAGGAGRMSGASWSLEVDSARPASASTGPQVCADRVVPDGETTLSTRTGDAGDAGDTGDTRDAWDTGDTRDTGADRPRDAGIGHLWDGSGPYPVAAQSVVVFSVP